MRRRVFITLIGGATATWPLAARAQQGKRIRSIGVLISLAESDAQAQARYRAFADELARLGWFHGRNARIDVRWASSDAAQIRRYAAELVALAPDVILSSGGSAIAPLVQATRTIPIVFTAVSDPIGAGVVESLSRPGSNVTGFSTLDFGISTKWLELLKQTSPKVTRIAVVRDAALSAGIGQFAVLQSAAPSFGVELTPIGMRNAGEIERALTAFARGANGGLIISASGLAFLHRDLLVGLAARHRLPAIYFNRIFADAGGLLAYGTDTIEMHRLAAGYVDRILKGANPADLPVQAPSKFELVVNLKTAKALGLAFPEALLVAANEVIE